MQNPEDEEEMIEEEEEEEMPGGPGGQMDAATMQKMVSVAAAFHSHLTLSGVQHISEACVRQQVVEVTPTICL